MKHAPLWLHQTRGLKEVLDTLAGEIFRQDEEQGIDTGQSFFAHLEANENELMREFIILAASLVERAHIFDCRQLPFGFVLDTAEAFIAEPSEIRGPVNLPFQFCYFEFANKFSVLCGRESEEVLHARGRGPMFFGFNGAGGTTDAFFMNGEFSYDPNDYPIKVTGSSDTISSYHTSTLMAGKTVLGSLALMRDKLVTSEFVPDPNPRLNRKRVANGRQPLSASSTVITVNVAAVRRVVARTPKFGTHESPALHWRRGHWRTLHRGSEFEKRSWVRHCLVGDPAHGYVGHHDYRLIWQQPMLQSTATPV